MKKIYIITTLISIVITVLICLLITEYPKTNNKNINMNSYDYKCSYETKLGDDEGETNVVLEKNLYLKVDNDSYVTNALYENIYDQGYFSRAMSNLTQDLLDLYNEINGVETSITNKSKKTYVSISYNYNEINFKELRETLSNILEEDSLQATMKSKIKVDEYISKSSEYKCTKK